MLQNEQVLKKTNQNKFYILNLFNLDVFRINEKMSQVHFSLMLISFLFHAELHELSEGTKNIVYRKKKKVKQTSDNVGRFCLLNKRRVPLKSGSASLITFENIYRKIMIMIVY